MTPIIICLWIGAIVFIYCMVRAATKNDAIDNHPPEERTGSPVKLLKSQYPNGKDKDDSWETFASDWNQLGKWKIHIHQERNKRL